MKKLTKLGLAAALVTAMSSMAFGHAPPGELYFAVQFPDNLVPTMDGDLSDWDIVPIDPYTIRNDRLYSPVAEIQPVGRGEIDVSDINIRHIMGWNENANKLYVMSEVFDNIHNADRENPAAFWQDDAWEVEVNPDHTPTEEHNLEGEPANNFSYKWAVPPVEGSYQYYRPVSALEWLVDGSEWVSFGWGFDGEQFGESTYRYELAITPITSLPNDASATPDQAVVFDLGENEIIHTSITVGDFDEACTECVLESYQGFWTMSPEMCCTGTNDVVLAEMEPSLMEEASTAVDVVSWGQIKAAY
ncbi:MAG: hypothetical protein HOL51_17565 [Gemmatimonadetes bacterium]|jgi:hypothetical protein|nr:hypothetical protein [Gemmatimonadota bacterium]MBT5327923.1 hypothetical protein [Gemmatimonadota bacterium]MBT5447565.1 hypothetical protein [Gemmatimonadota bacterium]MBT5802580.1 hypothetical protein [Gemmatimonadota bacterium]MBT6623255.1 hypothetical protein [Gemmatimonadota bacterium]